MVNDTTHNRSARIAKYSLIGVVAVAGFLGKRYQFIDIAFRLSVSLVPFALALTCLPREYLRAIWLWATVIPLFVTHLVLFFLFLHFIETINMWLWGAVVVVECVVLVLIVARASPEERHLRRRPDADNQS